VKLLKFFYANRSLPLTALSADTVPPLPGLIPLQSSSSGPKTTQVIHAADALSTDELIGVYPILTGYLGNGLLPFNRLQCHLALKPASYCLLFILAILPYLLTRVMAGLSHLIALSSFWGVFYLSFSS